MIDQFERLFVNPLSPCVTNSSCIAKILILKQEGIIQKISYERRDYESVGEKSLSYTMYRKTIKNPGSKGSNCAIEIR